MLCDMVFPVLKLRTPAKDPMFTFLEPEVFSSPARNPMKVFLAARDSSPGAVFRFVWKPALHPTKVFSSPRLHSKPD